MKKNVLRLVTYQQCKQNVCFFKFSVIGAVQVVEK